MSDLKTILHSIKDSKSEQNLYQHLSNVFSKILLENPKNAYDFFEDISYNVKFNGYDFQKIQEPLHRMKEKYEEIQDYSVKAKTFYDKINVGTEEEPQEPPACGFIPNFMEESKWFEWAGIYFGEEQSYQIYRSLMKLCISKNLKQVKFWGKILGSKKDYFVAEGIPEDLGEQADLPPIVEAKGTGVNKLFHWVTNDVLIGEWTELPIVTPDQLISARKIKYLFTGNLETDVIVNPFFYGKEKHLLKAQIIRITHSTAILPRGIYKKTEDNPNETEYNDEENWVFPSFETLKKQENWVHLNPSILNQGRITHFKPEFGGDANEEEEMKKIEAKDPYEPRLKPIKDDSAINGFNSAWNLKVYGDSLNYEVSGFKKAQTSYGIIAIKSNIWPGSLTVLNNQTYSSIYVGYGSKANGKLFYPKEPQPLMTEPQDIEEQPEPNHPKEQEIIGDKTNNNPDD